MVQLEPSTLKHVLSLHTLSGVAIGGGGVLVHCTQLALMFLHITTSLLIIKVLLFHID